VHAQSAPHGIAAVVNSDIVTIHDLRQRVLFMLATTGAERDEASVQRLQRQALRNLVDEHLQMQEAGTYEVEIADEEVNASVGSEIAWQRIVNGLYGSRIRISDAQIDETLNQITANASKPNYRVAEIYIEATPDIGGMEGALEGANAMIQQVQSGAPFPLLAQQFSSAASAARGGDVGWVREGELRPEIDNVIKEMEPGSVSKPIQVPGGYYVVAMVEKKISEADTLYSLKQVTVKIVEALERTDVGGLSDPFERPDGATSIMVCKRQTTGSDIPTRDQIEDRLLDQQLAQASKRALRDLRRQATLVVR